MEIHYQTKTPYNIVNGEYLADLYTNGIIEEDPNQNLVDSLEKNFSPWSDNDWKMAKSFGQIKK